MLNKDSKTVHMLSEFKGYGNTVGILAYYNVLCAGGGTSPFHAPLLNLRLLSHPHCKISGSATARYIHVHTMAVFRHQFIGL